MKQSAKTIIGMAAAGAAAAYVVAQKKRRDALREVQEPAEIHGFVKSGYEAVRMAFAENFSERREIGAACCVYHKGEKVVDLWGGIRNIKTDEPWEEDTMALVYSATKGMAAMTLAVAHSRGWLDYDALVSTYWPEFGRNGKGRITVRQLLAHQAGLFMFHEPITKSLIADPDRLAQVMAHQKPAWEPGTHQAYHAITIGFYEGELLRRVDPQHRSLGQFFQDEIAAPLGLDFYIRLPESIPDSRLAPLIDPSYTERLLSFPFNLTLDALNPHSNIRRALDGSMLAHDEQRIYARNLEIPAGGGVGTARAIAQAYSVFATGGKELRLRSETLHELMAPATPPTHGFHDEVIKGEVQFSLGFMKPSSSFPYGSPGAFGMPGAGGSFGFADPELQVGYGYIPNRKGVTITGDPRDVALRSALYSATPVVVSQPVVPTQVIPSGI
ncbi:serine hydrolase domain-containing protein [Pontibacter russatus]|uniref:serine hydrolase domain-containing protein n=1 Tax=Pontibacter russatus TaxID=2694929 RepID=UPI00192A314A|nr:serine hydrolase domain-containing protein [Pontibacter russatus]